MRFAHLLRNWGREFLLPESVAALVEPFFRKEFARDAFLASFRYVLPKEFKNEVEKILRNVFICERQIWTVKIEKVSDDIVFVTTSFERVIENKTSSTQKKGGLYTVPEFHFANGNVKIVECGIASASEKIEKFELETKEQVVKASTKDIDVPPGGKATLWGKATQYKRSCDVIYEVFGTPAVDPEIEVIIPDDMCHVKEFGTIGDVQEERFSSRYKLHGVYFPGQYMLVQWWPKRSKANA